MKQVLFSVFCIYFSCVNLYSQELLNNFKQDDNKLIIWQNVIETELNNEQLNTLIKESGYFTKIEELENKTLCELKPFKANYQAYGYSNMKAPIYISRSLVSGNVVIEFRENKYRITIKNIVFTQNIEDIFTKQGEVETFESWVLNKNQIIKPAFFNDGSDILNKEFKVKTTFLQKESESW